MRVTTPRLRNYTALLLLLSLCLLVITLITKCHTPATVFGGKYVTLPDGSIEASDVLQNSSIEGDESFLSIYKLDVNKGMWDRSHLFKIYPFVVTAQSWQTLSDWNVCLSSQCSADLLFWVVEQTKTWKGPMSVAVFVPDVDYTIAHIMIKYMRSCFNNVKNRVSFHMIYPSVLPAISIDIDILEFDCSRPEEVNKELIRLIRTDTLRKNLEISRYPQNLLRNTARQGCQAEYCFTPDIDMLSPPHIADQINNFLTMYEIRTCKKCAYITPTYEISANAPSYPSNKYELLSYLKTHTAQRFHIKVFSNNQYNSNLTKWENLPISNSNVLSVAYTIDSWKSHWEPVYVTQSNVVPFDERFIGYGFTRNSQVYEMRVAGYTWHMLDNAFLLHRGFQNKRTHSKTRNRQVAQNNARFCTFVREIHQRYDVPLGNECKTSRKSRFSKDKKKTPIPLV